MNAKDVDEFWNKNRDNFGDSFRQFLMRESILTHGKLKQVYNK